MREWIVECQNDEAEFPEPELIRCRDCKYYSKGTIEGKHICTKIRYAFAFIVDDGYCADAERKEE